MKKAKITKLFAASLVLSALALSHVGASTFTGAASNEWSDDDNWDPAPPTAGGDIVIADTTTTNGLLLEGGRSVGSITYGDTGLRASPLFTFNTGEDTLVINDGLVAGGNMTGGVQLTFNGNITIQGDQIWDIGGDIGSSTADRGVRIQQSGTENTVLLNGNLTKTGGGQLLLAFIDLSGNGDLIINDGALKINAASSNVIKMDGPGIIEMNNSSILMFSRNTGTFDVTRAVEMNDTSGMQLGGGGVPTAEIDSAIAWNGEHDLVTNHFSSPDFNFNGPWSGDGAIVRSNSTGGARVVINGDASAFSGVYENVTGATLINGPFGGEVDVAGGTVEIASSAFAGSVSFSGGTVRVGADFDGSLDYALGSLFVDAGVEVDGNVLAGTGADFLSLQGNVTGNVLVDEGVPAIIGGVAIGGNLSTGFDTESTAFFQQVGGVINVAGALEVNGQLVIELDGSVPSGEEFLLADSIVTDTAVVADHIVVTGGASLTNLELLVTAQGLAATYTPAPVWAVGGPGDWDTVSENWTLDGDTNFAWDNTANAGDLAIFDSGTGRIEVTEDISLAGITVTSQNSSSIGGRANMVYVFQGSGKLDFGSQQAVIDVTPSGVRNHQINNDLVGTGGLVLRSVGVGSGDGRTIFVGDNSGLTGGITVESGLFAFADPQALGENDITLSGGGLFAPVFFSGPGTSAINTPATATVNNNVTIDGSGNFFRIWGGRTVTLAGDLEGSGTVSRTDGGTFNLDGDGSGFTGLLVNEPGQAGSVTNINGLYGGDLRQLMQTVTVNTPFGGDLEMIGGTVNVNDDFTGTVSSFTGGTLNLLGDLATTDVTFSGGNLNVGASTAFTGDIVAQAGAGTLVLPTGITGNLTLEANPVTLTLGGGITGDLTTGVDASSAITLEQTSGQPISVGGTLEVNGTLTIALDGSLPSGSTVVEYSSLVTNDGDQEDQVIIDAPASLDNVEVFFTAAGIVVTFGDPDPRWLGGTSTDWDTDANWTASVKPDAGDDIIIADVTSNNLALDQDRTVGSITYGDIGLRESPLFNIITGEHTLTVQGGLVANGNIGPVALSFVGNVLVDGNQTWSVGGDPGAVDLDRGVRLVNTGNTDPATLVTLDGDIVKEGPGKLMFAAVSVDGPGSVIVNDGSFKLNAANTQLLTFGGTGVIEVNNNAELLISRNSGTFDISRAIVMNDTSAFRAGGGGSGLPANIASTVAWNGTHSLVGVNNNPVVFEGEWTGDGEVERDGGEAITIAGDSPAFSGELINLSGVTNIDADFGGVIDIAGGLVNLNVDYTGDIEFADGGFAAAAGTTITGDVDALFGAEFLSLAGTVNGNVFVDDPFDDEVEIVLAGTEITGNLEFGDPSFAQDSVVVTQTNGPITVGGTLTINGDEPLVINADGSVPSGSALVTYSAISASGFVDQDEAVVVQGLRSAQVSVTPTAIIVTYTEGAETLTWTGAESGAWQIGGPLNWELNEEPGAFLEGDSAIFPTGAATTTVEVDSAVGVADVTVDNVGFLPVDPEDPEGPQAPQPIYSFTGSGITATGSFTKTNTGLVAFNQSGGNIFPDGFNVLGGTATISANQQATGAGPLVVENATLNSFGTSGNFTVTYANESISLDGATWSFPGTSPGNVTHTYNFTGGEIGDEVATDPVTAIQASDSTINLSSVNTTTKVFNGRINWSGSNTINRTSTSWTHNTNWNRAWYGDGTLTINKTGTATGRSMTFAGAGSTFSGTLVLNNTQASGGNEPVFNMNEKIPASAIEIRNRWNLVNNTAGGLDDAQTITLFDEASRLVLNEPVDNEDLHLFVEDGLVDLADNDSVVGQLTVGGVPQDPGVYTTATHPGFLTGNGQLTVLGGAPPASAYDSWLVAAGLTPGDPGTGPFENLDGSGVANIVQFALGGNPNDPADNGTHVLFTTDGDDNDALVLTIAVREGATFAGAPSPTATLDGITYEVQGSVDLEDWSAEVVEAALQAAGIPAPPAGYELKSFRLVETPALETLGFLRVSVDEDAP